MKRSLIAAVALTLSFAAWAQTPQAVDGAKQAEAITQRMTAELGLSPEQASEVEKINRELVERSIALQQATAKQREEGNYNDLKVRMKQVLTAEQYERYLNLQQTRATMHTPDGQEIRPVKQVE